MHDKITGYYILIWLFILCHNAIVALALLFCIILYKISMIKYMK